MNFLQRFSCCSSEHNLKGMKNVEEKRKFTSLELLMYKIIEMHTFIRITEL